MKKCLFLFVILLIGYTVYGQSDEPQTVKGKVLNAANDKVLSGVNIINLTQVSGTITNEKGYFEIPAEVGDTLYFSYLGFKPIRIGITDDWIKFGNVKIKMTEMAFALDPVVLKPIELTGYLQIDTKNIPIYNDYRYQISNLNSGYEAGYQQPIGFSATLSSIFNPVDFLHLIFTQKAPQMEKLRAMKEDKGIRQLLETKFDRKTLMVLLHVSEKEIKKILKHCNYSKTFIETANDLQVLDAISECYERYKALNRN